MEMVHRFVTNDIPKLGEVKYKLGDCFSKIDQPGFAWCRWCEDKVRYGGRGKIHLIDHCVKTAKHLKFAKLRKTNYQQSDAYRPTPSSNPPPPCNPRPNNVFPMFRKDSTVVSSGSNVGPVLSTEVSEPVISLTDRTANMEAMILAFVAEHSLPLSLADPLVTLIKEASRDPKALNHVCLSKTTASNKMKFGLGKTLTQEIISKLRGGSFSLNTDEATNEHGKKVLSLIARYFDDDTGKSRFFYTFSVIICFVITNRSSTRVTVSYLTC